MPETDKLALLRRYWGYASFRPRQEEVIDSVLARRDTIALMPTGGGKSLCYQLPALMMEGVCVVVSPLIALMKDQVQQLRDRGIQAAHIVAGMNAEAARHVTHMAYSGSLKLLYVSPERLRQRAFCEQMRQVRVSLIAVDEAHCVSQWGHDFRPPYRQIADFRQLFPGVPVLALTASATPDVLADIAHSLQLRDCCLVRTGFGRPNLAYTVVSDDNKLPRLLGLVRQAGGSAIVYVRRRMRAERMAEYLQSEGIAALAYHGGLDGRERDRRQAAWMEGRCAVMVATNAFGMGIDKPDVRLVAHLELPDSVEAYYQEAGRAGRDGLPAKAVLLAGTAADQARLRADFERSFPPPAFIRNVYRALANHYRVPLGTGMGARFDFELEKVAAHYRMPVVDFYNACRFLQREGLIEIPDREETESLLYVPVSHTELYHFRVDHRRLGDLIEAVMRTYSGIGMQQVAIDERKIAQRAACSATEVGQMLTQLDAMHIVRYTPRTKKPQIYFTHPRIDERDILLSEQNYAFLKQQAQRRLEAMVDYATQHTECRAHWLMAYFGDEVPPTGCGLCDVCQRGDVEARVEDQVLALLRRVPLRATDLAAHLPQIAPDVLYGTVRQMMDDGLLSLDKDLLLKV